MTNQQPQTNGFILTRQWRDGREGLELVFWMSTDGGPVRVVVRGQEAVCFIQRESRIESDAPLPSFQRRPLQLKTLSGHWVDGLYFRRQGDLFEAQRALRGRGIELCESDIKPSDRHLMERFVTGACRLSGNSQQQESFKEYLNPGMVPTDYEPSFKAISLDIETEDLEGALYSIAVASAGEERVFMAAAPRPGPADLPIDWCGDEAGVLRAFFAWLKKVDPDLILGWNVAAFDLTFLERKCLALSLPFAMARDDERATILQPKSGRGVAVARIPGRVALDGIELLRAGFWAFESFELEVVAHQLLGRGKAIQNPSHRIAEIQRMYREDPIALAEYNIQDCRLVLEIFERTNLLEFARKRAAATGLAMDRYGGSVAAFDHLYLPRLHRAGRVAPDVVDIKQGPGSPGGYVMDSMPGLYDNVLLFDFKSLYPSIIRTYHIDPLALAEPGPNPIPGFQGAIFSRDKAILPDLVADLWKIRDHAKANKDAALSQAVKIVMNSFYGVLGTSGCRFHDDKLASSITRRGHAIIQESRDFIEQLGHKVIYGDTDSLFVLPAHHGQEETFQEFGSELANRVNAHWRKHLFTELELESFLEMEFETHFIKFLMPTIRGAKTGSKKRYAGLVRRGNKEPEVIFKGLESVRTDWTPLAQRVQRELYRRIFLNEPFEDLLRSTVDDLKAGRLDHELVYRKRLRRPLDHYTKNVPPHVQAARKLARPERWVRYVITSHGPEPVLDEVPRPDYDHYLDRQLKPVADGILGFLGTSFKALASDQLEIF